MNKFWVCFVEGTSGGYHRQHTDKTEAQEEAMRLARLLENQEKKVFILEVVACCQVEIAPISWHNIE